MVKVANVSAGSIGPCGTMLGVFPARLMFALARFSLVVLCFEMSMGMAYAEPALSGITSADQSLFVKGTKARLMLEAKGLCPGERRPLAIILKDEAGKEVGSISNGGIVADARGCWRGEFPLRTDFLGFRRVCVSSDDLTLPKCGSRPTGCLTYAVLTDWNDRPKIAEEECFFGLQGGDYGKWVGAHWLYSRSNPQTDSEKSKACQTRLLTDEFPIYGTIAAEYRFVRPFMTKEAVDYFDLREKDAPRMPFSIPEGDAEGERLLRESIMTYAKAARTSRPGQRIYEYSTECDINSPDPETMVRSMRVVYDAIHAADPEALVCAAGVSTVKKIDYMRRLFDLGIASSMDGFNLHPYTDYPPERSGFVESLRSMIRLVRECKGPDTPLIATEQGYAAPFEKEVMQMEGNVRVALILLGEGFMRHLAFWGYDFGNDHFDSFDGDYGYNYNLELMTKRWGGDSTSPRPTLPAMSAACLFLDGKRPVTVLEELGDTALGYAYADKEDKCVLALWDYGGAPHETMVDVGRDEIDVADIMGNVRREKTRDGVLPLMLTGSPCYVLDPNPALWGRNGSMKAQLARLREQRRQREEAARQVEIRAILPQFFGACPGMKVEVENRTSHACAYSVETRIPGVPEARRSARISLPARGKDWVLVPFASGVEFDPSVLREMTVTVKGDDGYRATHSEKVNFLCAEEVPAAVGANGDFLAWSRPRRFRWPVEKDGPKVWMALGWNANSLLVETVVSDNIFTNCWTGFDTWRGDSVQLGFARAALKKSTGNFQTDMQEVAKSEITLAMTKDGPRAYRTETFDPARFPSDIKGSGEIPASELPLEIRHATNGTEIVTRYRAAVPWRFLNIRQPTVGQVVRLAAFANDNDTGKGMSKPTRWFELKTGAPEGFAFVTLGRNDCGNSACETGSAVREIGQSQKPGTPPVEWTDCAWCVADEEHNVYLPGGWRIPRNSREAEKCASPFGAEDTLVSDGCGHIWFWNCRSGVFGEVRKDGKGLRRGKTLFTTKNWENFCFFVAPPGLATGFAAKAKFGALVRYRSEIRGYDADGRDLGVLFDCAAAGLKAPYCAAFEPQTGDLLVSNEWPDRHVHRFTADRREVLAGVWPYPIEALVIDSVDGRDIYLSGRATERVGKTLMGPRRFSFGQYATETHALADGGDGWWLATTQGAQHYLKSDPSRCDRRIGGVAAADRVAIKDGKVLVADGKRLFMTWLDAEPDEIFCSDERSKADEKTMPENLSDESGRWRAEYDPARKSIKLLERQGCTGQAGLKSKQQTN